MKKRLVLLPLLAGLALTGCEITLFGKKIGGGGEETKTSAALQELLDAGAALKNFQGHELVTSVKDGEEYLFGVYRKNEDLMRFVSGDYHRDDNGFYPFYMGTVAGTTEGAATVKVEMLEGNTFGLKISCNSSLPWNGKYIGVYAATSSYSNEVTSIALLDSPTQTSFRTIANHQAGAKTVTCSGVFEMYEYYEGMPACAPGVKYLHPSLDEDVATPKFLGTGHNNSYDESEPDYTSIDAKQNVDALSIDAYDLAHLYTK